MRWIAADILTACCAAIGLSQSPPPKGVNFYSLTREVAIGKQIAAELAAELPLVHDPDLTAYISKLGAALATHIDPVYTCTFSVYEDRKAFAERSVWMAMPADAFSNQAAEPIALPGGPILVPISLLANAADEGELAFHLAHAMAHVWLRHASRLATRLQLMDASGGGHMLGDPSPQTKIAMEMTRQAGRAGLARRFELDADRIGAGLLAAAGYSPDELERLFSRHTAENPAHSTRSSSVHPSNEERLRAIHAEREKLPPGPYTASTGDFDRVKALALPVR